MTPEKNSTLITALENERRYVARELHDGVAQTVQQLGLYGGICRKLLERNDTESLAEQLAEMEGRIHAASMQVREMIADFRPPLVEPNSGLLEYIQFAIDTHHERQGASVSYRNRLGNQVPQLSAQQILTISRIIQEALLNIRKHAAAQNVLFDVAIQGKQLILTIADDGCGFDVDGIEHRAPDKGGAGLQNMRARANAIGGGIKIGKGTTDGGTAVMVTLPVN